MPGKSLDNGDLCRQLPSTSQDISRPPSSEPSDVCAKFLTTNKLGQKGAILLSFGKSVTIGRDPRLCNYVIPDIVVSNIHCRLHVIPSPTIGSIVSCEDFSTNGVILNGMRMRKASIMIMDGDTLEIPHSQTFSCVHTVKCKAHIFDPTQAVQKRIGNYVVTSHCLGTGTFGTVHLALDKVERRQVACKSVRVKNEKETIAVMKEFNTVIGLHHPNINMVFDIIDENNYIHIFLELCTGGDLFNYVSGHTETGQRLIEGEAKYIMYQLLKGLKYLHDKAISHRDLKLENILLCSPGPYPKVQIADFGLARRKAYEMTFNVCGTIQYLPPECILALGDKTLGYVGMPFDCWSVGVILHTMLAGYNPFDNEHPLDTSECYDSLSQPSRSSPLEEVIKQKILNVDFTFDPEIWDDMPHAKRLVDRFLIYNPLQRATINLALQSRWITDDQDELEQAYRKRIEKGPHSSSS